MFISFKIGNCNRTILYLVFTAVMLFFSINAAAGDKEALSVKIRPKVKYASADGKRFTARYGSLSDGSLHFVKITMPDGKEYTLPQVMSGSGVRYTDEREVVWWTHQGTVRIDVRDTDGKWITKYSELKEIKKPN